MGAAYRKNKVNDVNKEFSVGGGQFACLTKCWVKTATPTATRLFIKILKEGQAKVKKGHAKTKHQK